MRYNVIEIRPDYIYQKWESRYHYDDTDRCDDFSEPHAMGFYYCPETISVEDGFNALKNKMIAAHKEEINRLQKSLDDLEKLEIQLKN